MFFSFRNKKIDKLGCRFLLAPHKCCTTDRRRTLKCFKVDALAVYARKLYCFKSALVNRSNIDERKLSNDFVSNKLIF